MNALSQSNTEVVAVDLSTILLAIYLILVGLAAFVRLSFPSRDKVTAAIALLAGIFILVGL